MRLRMNNNKTKSRFWSDDAYKLCRICSPKQQEYGTYEYSVRIIDQKSKSKQILKIPNDSKGKIERVGRFEISQHQAKD